MQSKYEHYITKNIRAFYMRRLFSPIIFLILLGFLWFVFPLQDLLFPKHYSRMEELSAISSTGTRYISTTFPELFFTGYVLKNKSRNIGYYYYGIQNGECMLIILNPTTCDEGNPNIHNVTVRGEILPVDDSLRPLLAQIADDLNWTEDGLKKQISPCYFSEPDYNRIATNILFLIYFGSMIYAILCLITYLVYIRFPVVSPPCQNLVVFGRPKQMLLEAEEELATLPQLATEDMFITEHYFIMTSPDGNAFVPIKEILWIYKHSTLHKFLWYHFSISYTLHITANKHLYFHCPKNIKSDIDGIIDYLSEANHSILVGFSEENRLKVETVLGKPFHIEKLYALLRRKF